MGIDSSARNRVLWLGFQNNSDDARTTQEIIQHAFQHYPWDFVLWDFVLVGKRKAGLQTWLTGLCDRMAGRILSFNTSTAHVWGQLVARCDKGGITLPTADSQLAATAHPMNSLKGNIRFI